TGGGSSLVVLDARGGQVHCQAFDGGLPVGPAMTLDVGAAAQLRAPDLLIGDGASLLAAAFPLARQIIPEACDPAIVAALGAAEPPPPPNPVYMRAAYA
ncbi:MAG: tRNA (adenosine(37)-N6)-threonylcarbamoyltransferase complex dimerization subunit type 1 TsaB, partial [Alphaproteobacteria bacterium]